jgi:hypothetical protein
MMIPASSTSAAAAPDCDRVFSSPSHSTVVIAPSSRNAANSPRKSVASWMLLAVAARLSNAPAWDRVAMVLSRTAFLKLT